MKKTTLVNMKVNHVPHCTGLNISQTEYFSIDLNIAPLKFYFKIAANADITI